MLTSAEWDHPDVFADGRRCSTRSSAGSGVRPAAPTATPPVLVANVGDAGVAELVATARGLARRIVATALVDVAPQRLGGYARGIADRFATAAGPADALLGRIVATEPDGDDPRDRRASTRWPGPRRVRLPTAGRHNAANALGRRRGRRRRSASAPQAIVAGLGGVRRASGGASSARARPRGVVVYDDYGHHPTAIRATLAAVRQREPGRRVWAVYEPLTYHRTAALLDAFADALAAADAVADRRHLGRPRPGHDDRLGRGARRGGRRRAARTSRSRRPGQRRGDRRAGSRGEVRPGDAVLVMGGGRSYRIGELLLEHLEAR